MSTSGEYVLTTTALDIIKEALLICRAYDPNQTIAPEDRETGIRSLNYLIKHWQAQGHHLWNLEDAVIFMESGKQSYDLGPSGDHACLDSDFINTLVATAAIATDTTLAVDSSIGMVGAPDVFTSNQAADVNAWTGTQATLAVASDVLTVTNSAAAGGYAEISLDSLTVGSTYLITYGYTVGTSSSARFSVVSDAVEIAGDTQTVSATYTLEFTATQTSATFRVANISTTIGHDTDLSAMNYVDKTSTGDFVGIQLDDGTRQWLRLTSISGNTLSLNGQISSAVDISNTVYTYSDKIQRPMRVRDGRFQDLTTGDEIPARKWGRKDYFAQPDKTSSGTVTRYYYTPQLVTGKLYVWQTANSVKQLLRMGYTSPIEVFSDNSDSPDFPSEWFLPLAYGLAAMIAPQYKNDPTQQQIIEQKADLYLQDALGFDDEDASMMLMPDWD